MQKYKAPFITFEGGEGTGKSTQILKLKERLAEKNIPFVALREPGGTEGSEEIRNLIVKGASHRWLPITEALLMSASRHELVQRKILPALKNGVWVICDRFADSTTAYQGGGHKISDESIKSIHSVTIGSLSPDLTFIFKLQPEKGLKRTHGRQHNEDRFEQFDPQFHQRVAKKYEEIAHLYPNRCVVLDASKNIDVISQQIWNHISKKFIEKSGC